MNTIAADVGCTARTARRALAALFQIGMVKWVNRLVRTGRRVEQAWERQRAGRFA